MPGAGTKLASRFNFAALRQVASNVTEILVINLIDVIGAERANLSPWSVTSATAAGSATAWPVATLTAIGAEWWSATLSTRAKALPRRLSSGTLSISRWSLIVCHRCSVPRRTPATLRRIHH